MKTILTSIILLSSTVFALAGTATMKPPTNVPEISALAGIAALGVVGAVVALIWERRK